MAKEKVKNYTEDMVATMTEMYTGVDNKAEVKAISKAIDRTEGSVRAKLSNMALYVTKEKAKAKTRVTKATTVADISKAIGGGLTILEQDGLLKSTSAPLVKILAALTPDEVEEEESEEE